MIDHSAVQDWLDGYVRAWQSYDPQQIGDLFNEAAAYYPDPYSKPLQGREAIVGAWLAHKDQPGTYQAQYAPVVVEGDTAAASGRTRYFGEDGTTFRAEYSNVFLLRFDEDGRCREYREWFYEKPQETK